MRGRGALATAGAAAVTAAVVAVTGAALPAAGAARTPSGDATTGTPTETPTPTPTASPTPTVSPTPTATPTPTETAPVDDRLLPDLITLPARDAYIQVGNGRRLRFTSALGNIGDGPIEVRPNRNQPCPPGQHNSTQVIYRDTNGNGRYNPRHETQVTRQRAGCMVYHRFHEHWHFKASARYVLFDPRTPDDTVVAARRKVSFCLRDTGRVPQRYGTWSYPEAYGACSRRSPQGISVGWVDVYQRWLAGQVLRLPRGMDKGVYCLRTEVDPINQLIETDDTNNEAVRALRIKGTKVTPLPRSYCR